MSSCFSPSKKEGKELPKAHINYQLVQQPDKVIQLDNEAAFDLIQARLFVIQDVTYYSFFNGGNKSIYFYSLDSGNLVKKIQLSSSGPNSTRVFGFLLNYWAQDLDHILIRSFDHIYKISGKGEVLTSIKLETGNILNNDRVSFDEATEYKNGKLYCSLSTAIKNKSDTSWLRCFYDLEKGKIEERYIDERVLVPGYEEKAKRILEDRLKGSILSPKTRFVSTERGLFGTSDINDSIYLFEDFRLKEVYYAGNPNIACTDIFGYYNKEDLLILADGLAGIPAMVQPAHYTHLLISPNRQIIYRVLIHGTAAKANPKTGKLQPEPTGVSIIRFNTLTKNSATVNFPIESVEIKHFTNILATNEGILIPVKEQELEGQKVYKSFTFEAKD